MKDLLPLIINALLTSGIIVTLVTLRATRKRAKAEAKSAEIDNAQRLVENFDTFIVKPLKNQVDELKDSVQTLQMAIRQISNCPHRDSCPVAERLANETACSAAPAGNAHDRLQEPPDGQREPLP